MGIVSDIVLTIIGNEIKNDPETLGYSGKTLAEIIDILQTPRSLTIPEYTNVEKTPEEIIFILIKRGRWEAVKSAADSAVASGHDAAFALVEVTKLQTIQINWNSTAVQNVFNSLKAASIINQDDIDALTDEGRVEITMTRAEELHFPPLKLGIVAQAMIMVGLTPIY